MKRRDFLKILGVGVTIPLTGVAAGAASNNQNPFAKNYREEFIRGFYSKDNISITGGYDKVQKYHWMRTTVNYNGREWHDLVRKSGDQPLNYETIAKLQNIILERQNIPARVTEQMVKQAFEV